MKKTNKRVLHFVLTAGLLGAAALVGPGRLMPQAQAWCDYSAEYSDPNCSGGGGGSAAPDPFDNGGGAGGGGSRSHGAETCTDYRAGPMEEDPSVICLGYTCTAPILINGRSGYGIEVVRAGVQCDNGHGMSCVVVNGQYQLPCNTW